MKRAEAEVVRTALASDRAGIVRSRVESLFEIEARTEWNSFPVRGEDPEAVAPGRTDLFLAGGSNPAAVYRNRSQPVGALGFEIHVADPGRHGSSMLNAERVEGDVEPTIPPFDLRFHARLDQRQARQARRHHIA